MSQSPKTINLLPTIDLPPNGHFVIAVSGGVDSVVLLHFLATFWLPRAKAGSERRLQVAHLDHGLRPDSSLDRQLVSDLCRIYGLPFHFKAARLTQASEAVARKVRYDFLRQVAARQGASAIMTAHHLDDRTETSVFNLLRGADRVGLAPMSQSLNFRSASLPNAKYQTPFTAPVLRPLLKLSKNQLQDYARHHHLPWREDSTNDDINYSRNFIRHELLPTARLEQPNFDRMYQSALTQLDRLNRQIELQINQFIRRHGRLSRSQVALTRSSLVNIGPKPLEHLLARVLHDLEPGLQLSAQKLEHLGCLIKSGAVAERHLLSPNLWLRLEPESAVFGTGSVRPPQQPPNQPLPTAASLRFGRFQLSRGYLGRHLPGAIRVKSLDLIARTFAAGDRIAPVGIPGSQKLGDLFTNAKIPRAERLSYPIVASYNNEVVWVPGLAFSRHFVSTHPAADCLTYTLLS